MYLSLWLCRAKKSSENKVITADQQLCKAKALLKWNDIVMVLNLMGHSKNGIQDTSSYGWISINSWSAAGMSLGK